MSKKILVTGATGFIGKAILNELTSDSENRQIISFGSGLRLEKAESIEQMVCHQPDIIIHAAGKSFVPDSWKDPLSFYNFNTIGTLHVAEAARQSGARVIFLSTFVYGPPFVIPITEQNSETTFNPYAASKYRAENILNDFYKYFGVESNILRLFNVYGPGQRSEFLIPHLIRQFQAGSIIHVKDLKPKRDYVHLNDVAKAISLAVGKFNGFQVYNVASGESYSVKELINILAQLNKKEIEIVSSEETRQDEVMDTRASIEKIERELGWKPQISLRDGIAGLIK